MHRSEYIVRAVAVVLILWGLYKIIGESEGTWWSLRYGFSDLKFLWFHVLFLVFSVVIPVVAIISGWGLLKLKRWARLSALSISALIFALNWFGSINFAVQSYYARNVPVPEIPEGAVVGYYSMWPTYITAIASGILILVLRWRPIKNLFIGASNA